jgi:hypothetical protein
MLLNSLSNEEPETATHYLSPRPSHRVGAHVSSTKSHVVTPYAPDIEGTVLSLVADASSSWDSSSPQDVGTW